MAGPMQSTAFAGLIAPNLRKVVLDVGREWPIEYDKVLNTGGMDWNPMVDRIYAGLGTMPSMPQGDRFTMDQGVQGPTKQYEASPYGMGVEITYIMWRDDLYGVMRELVAGLAQASRYRMEISAWSAFNNAFNTSYSGFVSGESLCSTSHVSFADASVTNANRPSPDIGFGVTAIQGSVQRYRALTNARGLPRLIAPTMALINGYNQFVAREVLGSAGKPFTANNEVNSLLQEELSWMVCRFLTSQTAWFLNASKGVHDVNFLVRDEPIYDSWDDPFTKNAIFSCWQRHMAASSWGQWAGVDGSSG